MDIKKSKNYEKHYEKLQKGNIPFVLLNQTPSNFSKNELDIRLFVRMRIDAQKARIRCGNQIYANFRQKLGLDSSEKAIVKKNQDQDQDKDERAAIAFLNKAKKDFDRITDEIIDLSYVKKNKYFKKQEGIISSIFEYEIIKDYLYLLEREKRLESNIKRILPNFDIWNYCMSKIVGVGGVIAGSILAFVDIKKSESVSAFWRYLGIDVRPNGQGSSKMYPKKNEKGEKNEQTNYVIQEYINSNGELDVKKSLGYGTFVKSKLLGVLPKIILANKNNPDNEYAKIFYNSRKMYQNHPDHKWKSKLHIQRMANRKMIQVMCMHIWICWRSLEGLDIKAPYHERVLGQTHKGNTQLEICKKLYPLCF